MKKRPFSDLNEEEYKKRYKKLKTFLKTGDIFIGKARKYNRYIETDRHEGCSCVPCVRKHFSYPWTCADGWEFYRNGKEAVEKGETCLNWTDKMDCEVD